jgi:glycosyltransferase involved in cell wall biosynthesis
VRLSAEKEPERFVALVEALSSRGALTRAGVVPALVGAPRDAYAAALLARLRAAAPEAEIITDFMSPAALGERVFARAALNVHPPLYESFGMTVLEAAAWGAPTLLHAGDGKQQGVGAAEVLRPEAGHAFASDLSAPAEQLADVVEALLADGAALRAVGDAARSFALAHDEAANAAHTGRALAAALAAATQHRAHGEL